MQQETNYRRSNFQASYDPSEAVARFLSEPQNSSSTNKRASFSQLSDYLLESLLQGVPANKLYPELIDLLEAGHIGDEDLIELIWLVGSTLRLPGAPSSKSSSINPLETLSGLIKRMLETKRIDRKTLSERLDDALLGECGLIELKTFEKKKLRLMTKNIYEQQKFNLLREESEGYSKLCMELLELKDRYEDKYETSLKNITSLIGFFDLDINRVIDLILEFTVHNTGTDLYFRLLKTFKKEFISQILGYRFEKMTIAYKEAVSAQTSAIAFQASNQDNKAVGAQKKPAGPNLALLQPSQAFLRPTARIAAKLVKMKLVKVSELWPHLSPVDQTVTDTFKENYSVAFELYKRNCAPKLTVTAEDIDREKEELIRYDKTIKAQHLTNQKLWLMQGLLAENDFVDFEHCANLFGPFVDFNTHQPLLTSLCELLEWFIEPAYRPLSPSLLTKKLTSGPQLPTSEDSKDLELRPAVCDYTNIFSSKENADQYLAFMQSLRRIMIILKQDIAFSSTAFVKLCRVFKHFQRKKTHLLQESKPELVSIANEIEEIRFQIIKDYLVAGLPLLDCNPAAVAEVWALLEAFDYMDRFNIYDDWFTKLDQMTPRLLNAHAEFLKQAKFFLRLLTSSDKEIDKGNARIFAKICHNAPCVVLNEVIKQLRIYNNITPWVSTSMAYSLPLSVEVSLFLSLRHLSEFGKATIKVDECRVEQWLQNISSFIGVTVKKHHKVDLSGLFTYLTMRLSSDSDFEAVNVVIFNDVLSKMSGYDTDLSLTDKELASLSGGIALKTESFGLTEQVRSSKKSSKSLADFLWSKKSFLDMNYGEEVANVSLPFLLLALMSKMKDQLTFRSEIRNPQCTDYLYDMINGSMFQFSLFLSYHSSNNYIQLLPEQPWNLLMKLQVAPEVAYKIVRPSFKPMHKMDEREWREVVSKVKASFDDFSTYRDLDSPILNPEDADELDNFVKSQREAIWNSISPELYTAFWLLEAENLYVPVEAYTVQIEKLQEFAKGDQKSKSDKNAEKLKKTVEMLKQEQGSQQKEKEKLDGFLETRKASLTANFIQSNPNIAFLQYCCLPRLKLSPADAVFCAKFIDVVYSLSQISFVDQITFKFRLVYRLFPSVQCCSKEEAACLGIFFREVMSITEHLHDDHKLWNIATGKKFDKNAHPELNKIKLAMLLTLKKVVEVVESLFSESSFMQARNLLTVLSRMKGVFPITKEHTTRVLEIVRKRVPDQEPNGKKNSLDILSQSYKIALTKPDKPFLELEIKDLDGQSRRDSKDNKKAGKQESVLRDEGSASPNKPTRDRHVPQNGTKEKPKQSKPVTPHSSNPKSSQKLNDHITGGHHGGQSITSPAGYIQNLNTSLNPPGTYIKNPKESQKKTGRDNFDNGRDARERDTGRDSRDAREVREQGRDTIREVGRDSRDLRDSREVGGRGNRDGGKDNNRDANRDFRDPGREQRELQDRDNRDSRYEPNRQTRKYGSKKRESSSNSRGKRRDDRTYPDKRDFGRGNDDFDRNDKRNKGNYDRYDNQN